MSDLLAAMAALRTPAATAAGRGVTSDLTIDETLLLHSVGWEPVDLVVGVSWWSLPWSSWQWRTGEVGEASQAFAGAMAQATDEMRQECLRAGGTGVVGVAVELSVRSTNIQVALAGTAVRAIDHHPRPPGKGRSAATFVSDLSARDFSLLLRAGWAPVSLVAGASFVIAPRRSASQWAQQKTQSMEMPNLTQALYLARERAMERMQEGAMSAGADGVVGVKLQEGPLAHNARVMRFIAVGTAITLVEVEHRTVSPTMVVSLDDPVVQFAATTLGAQV
ncbi:MAG TPA: heavy metal-binding domain-containing protein [Acidimicrobiales bacterium]|nr:heavy metal-binding domain-containing protein [Acidimicrobiales bacterium]